MTIQNILTNFLVDSTCPLVCLLVVLAVVGLAGGLACGYVYLMRKYGKQVAAFLLSVALFSAVVADKSGTNAPPNGVSGTNVVEQIGGEGTNDIGGVAWPLMAGRRINQMENEKWKMDNVGGLVSILHSPLSILNLAEPFALRPVNAVENAWWRARGAHVDGMTIPAEGWSFRTTAGFLDSLLVYSCGEIQPNVETTYFPRPFPDADLSLLPEGKWGMLPREGAESLFWHATSPSNSLILTWQSAAYNRDANCPTNLQIELFSNGTYVYRFDDRTERHAVEYPFDLDGDGLENSVDPEPLVAGSDAHGTNAEWYDRVCSGVFAKTEQPNGLPIPLPGGESVFFKPGVNTNAYYFVDVVAERGPAPIHFNSSHPGRLDSPVVVALGGETNRVPLLIGATYSVSSDVPFTVSCPTNGFAEVSWSDGANAMVKWPLNFTFTEELSGTSRSYTVGVEPFDPGGTFSWGGDQGGATLQGMVPPSGGACGCVSGNGATVTFGCSSTCTCCGSCRARGWYHFEFASFLVEGGECRCGFDDPTPFEQPTFSPLDGPSLMVSFSAPAVIFEDAYVDSPGVTQPRRSTRTLLTVSAWGGQNGGMLSLTSQNLEKLVPVACGPMMLPQQVVLVPYQQWTVSYLCEGVVNSDSEKDVVVTGSFVEESTGCQITDNDSLTIVKVMVRPEERAPENRCEFRHTYGVYELVDLDHSPVINSVQWSLQGGGTDSESVDGFLDCGIGGLWVLRCPLYNNQARLEVTCEGVVYSPSVRFVEPSGVLARNPRGVSGKFPTNMYGAEMLLDLYVLPLSVSFTGLAIEEIPSTEVFPDYSTSQGYFLSEPLWKRSHTYEMGAGRWFHVSSDNKFCMDQVSTGTIFALNVEGILSWYIPMGWNRANVVQYDDHGESVRHVCFREFAPLTYWQNFYLYTNGITILSKHGFWVMRDLNDIVITGALEQ